ncbi:lipase family protein [Rhodococcoides corynebacterioides]|uniref:lipase family protein n=1 Tax=Rhodococcoides corynebacterioides TaxID=53972 RepID=UPI000A5B8A4E|nr:lipase family protein [Rhodococcus corynebacterioides]
MAVRRRRLVTVSAVLGAVVVIAVAVVVVVIATRTGETRRDDDTFQASLADFYATPDKRVAPGELIRVEEIADLDVPGGTALRMLYGSEGFDGSPRVSSGMLLIPDAPAPPGGRPVLAWAHGTLGLGDDCTPSRHRNPTLAALDMANWVPAVMARGWVVAATDYVGVGTEGDPYYLIARSEAQDVVNSVRAARGHAPAQANTTYVAFGHSQGGHSALATAAFADYAPELTLAAVAAAAPAVELGPLFSQQYRSVVAWGIGPSVAVTWPSVYPDLPLSVLTERARDRYESLGRGCLSQQAVELLVDRASGAQFFAEDPLQDPAWQRAVAEQTLDVARLGVPLFVVQSLADQIVLPNTTALLARNACSAAEPALTMAWLGQISHQDTAMTGGLLAVDWLADRLAGVPAGSTCGDPLPVEPASAGP